MKKQITIDLLHNDVTNNIIITISKGVIETSVTLAKEFHPALHSLLLSELKSPRK